MEKAITLFVTNRVQILILKKILLTAAILEQLSSPPAPFLADGINWKPRDQINVGR